MVQKDSPIQKEMNNNVFRMSCWFEGHVQGVGFRYQTINVAKGFEVTGTVENLPDGRVFLYAEGDESEVSAFQKEVAVELADYIRKTDLKSDTGLRAKQGFRIVQ
jgi:acylphosphatase